jgi:cytochrome c-type biogenesis protein CcmE
VATDPISRPRSEARPPGLEIAPAPSEAARDRGWEAERGLARPSRSVNRRALIGGGILSLAIAYLAWGGFAATMVYYVTVGELLAQGAQAYDRPVRVAGRAVDGTLVHDVGTGTVRFEVTDGTGKLPVVYRGIKPDMLGYSSQGAYQDVVVEGRLGSDGTMRASTLIVKHGPEFEAAPGQAGPATGQGAPAGAGVGR